MRFDLGVLDDPATPLTLGTYGVMAGLGLALHQHRSSKTLGSSIMIAAGIGIAFTVASLATQKLAKAPRPAVEAPV